MLQNHILAIRAVVLATVATITIVFGMSHSCSSQMNDPKCDSKAAIGLPDLSPFGYDLFFQVSQTTDKPNILLSPFSIASALALVLAGATPNSTCQTQIQSVLSISSHSQISSLSQQIIQPSSDADADTNIDDVGGGKAVQLTSANGLWIKESILKPYIEIAQDVHNSEVSPLPDTFDPIDAYISTKTNGMIKNILEGPIDGLTRAILINAIYFKGTWKDKFDRDLTKEGIFKNNIGEHRKAMFMEDTRKIQIATDIKELGQASIVSIEYGAEDASSFDGKKGDSAFCALFFLPPKNTSDSLSNVFSSLAKITKRGILGTTSLKDILVNNMQHKRVHLVLPRFRISYGTESLKPQLKSMGMHKAFGGEEGFLQMSEDPQLYLDDVFHKAVMEVTEEGTVASAATAAIMMSRSIPQPPKEMIFDRPFGMVVLHTPSMTPLFVARVDDPEFV